MERYEEINYMKLVKMTVSNYRQFEKAELDFDEDITILAGANNSGKTSLITLVKSIFCDDKIVYNESDIPAKNMKQWIDEVYPTFENFFNSGKSLDDVETELVECILPEDESKEKKIIRTTDVKVHVEYDPDKDDIKLFADYIMDLDEKEHSFYFMYSFEVNRHRFIVQIKNEFEKIGKRFAELNNLRAELKTSVDEKKEHNFELKKRYLQELLVKMYVDSIIPTGYFCDKKYINMCKIEDVKEFKGLFNFHFIKASRPLDDDESDHTHTLSRQMIKMVKLDDKWNDLIKQLPDELLKPIQEKEIDKTVRKTSLTSLQDTITALEQTSGGQTGELMLDMNVTEDDISELLQRITTATYNVDGYFLGESSQGLGYSNMIYIHLQLKEYEKSVDEKKVNVFFVEEPESHMHPQMQQVFIKYLLEYYNGKIQGVVTTHSNEMVRVAGLTHLRVIRRAGKFKSCLYNPSILINELKSSEEQGDKELANFFDWFFEIGYSEIVFADKAIFYEGDTERLYIKKLLTQEKYKKLNQQYIAYIQVGGAYAYNYRKLIELLKIKSLIITDIDYAKAAISIEEILDSTSTNATINHFYKEKSDSDPTVNQLYEWKKNKENVLDEGLVYVCFQAEEDGYARTLEEAMLSKHYNIDATKTYKKKEWMSKRTVSKLKYSIPDTREKVKIDDDDDVSMRDILKSTAGGKTDFMYSVILNENYIVDMEPTYISEGLEWLME